MQLREELEASLCSTALALRYVVYCSDKMVLSVFFHFGNVQKQPNRVFLITVQDLKEKLMIAEDLLKAKPALISTHSGPNLLALYVLSVHERAVNLTKPSVHLSLYVFVSCFPMVHPNVFIDCRCHVDALQKDKETWTKRVKAASTIREEFQDLLA